MQNRKAPVFLFGIVVVAVGAMAIWNATTRPAGSRQEDQQKSAEGVTTKQVSAQERAETEKELREKLASTREGGPQPAKMARPGDEPGDTMQLAKKPTILLDKFKYAPPKPNDSSPATHWYNEESRTAKLAEQQKAAGG